MARAWHAEAQDKQGLMQRTIYTLSRIGNQEKCAFERVIFCGGPLGALDSNVNENREA